MSCSADEECQQSVYVFHEGIIPSTGPHNMTSITPTTYSVQVLDSSCTATDEAGYSTSIELTNSKWADTVENTASSPYPPPDGVISITDVLAMLAKFQNSALASVSVRVDMLGSLEPKYIVDHQVGIGDVVQGLFAFTGVKYPSPAVTGAPSPQPCP